MGGSLTKSLLYGMYIRESQFWRDLPDDNKKLEQHQRENLVVIFNQPGLKDSESWKLQLIRLVNAAIAACSNLQ